MSRVDRRVLATCLQADLAEIPMDESPWASARSFAASKLSTSFLKKFQDDVSPEADSKALAKFLNANSHCESWRLELNSTKDEILFNEVKCFIDRFFHLGGELLIPSYLSLHERGRTGPGASIAARGTSFYSKLFSSRLSSTSAFLYEMYKTGLNFHPSWADAEVLRSEHEGAVQIVGGNSVSCVPKQYDISRVIATEPSLNMFFQLGLGAIIEERLLVFPGFNLRSQPARNQEMARMGSIDGTFGTIDLESASDTVSLNLCKEILPYWVFDLMRELRSPFGTLPDGSKVEYHMMSSMGNGFTFPFQTLVFTSVVHAVYKWYSIPFNRFTYGVFGDDIVVRREAYDDVLHLLGICGFIVNSTKSFNEGSFRESCGCDYFRGHNVRGVYLKTLKTTQDVLVAINRLNSWTARTGICLRETVRYLVKQVPPRFVPLWESDDCGIRVTRSFVQNPRYNRNGSFLYEKYEPSPSILRFTDEGVIVPRWHRKLFYNPYGAWIAFLRGEIRDGIIRVRHDPVRYRNRTRIAPNWDRSDTVRLSQVEIESFSRALYQNLF